MDTKRDKSPLRRLPRGPCRIEDTREAVIRVLSDSNDVAAVEAYVWLVNHGVDEGYVCMNLHLIGDGKETPFGRRQKTMVKRISAAATALRQVQKDLEVAGFCVDPNRSVVLAAADFLDGFSRQWNANAHYYGSRVSYFDAGLNSLLHHVQHVVGRPCYKEVVSLVNLFSPRKKGEPRSEQALKEWRRRHPWHAPSGGG